MWYIYNSIAEDVATTFIYTDDGSRFFQMVNLVVVLHLSDITVSLPAMLMVLKETSGTLHFTVCQDVIGGSVGR